jgi:hypothetical protein
MKYKVLRPFNRDLVMQQPGDIIEASGAYAEMLVKSGAAAPDAGGAGAAPFETAEAPGPSAADRAVAPRQSHPKR